MKIRKQLVHLLFFYLLIAVTAVSAQSLSNDYSVVNNLHPVSSTAFQFLKYTQMPVSEYTGLPNVAVPLYQISEDGIKIPISLTYHGGGIRVSEEASWVGLGWDLRFGSVVQQINDVDDLSANTKIRPDYFNSGTPALFPYKYEFCNLNSGGDDICNYGCDGLLSIDTPTYADGLEIYTDYYAPFAGNYDLQGNAQNYDYFFYDHHYYNVDSEPDIFTASFLGQSIKFVLDWSTGKFVVLDNRGYKINYTGTGGSFSIIAPTGEEYDFALKSTISAISESQDDTGLGTGSYPVANPTSNIWFLTQIITKNKKKITFDYTNPNGLSYGYPSFSQRGIISTLTQQLEQGNTADWELYCTTGNVTDRTPTSGNLYSTSYPQENYYYLSGITFPNGHITFNISGRNDILGGSKLDSLTISSSAQVIKTWKFNYSYFDATGVGGNTFTFSSSTNFGNCPDYRLKLSSVEDNGGTTYDFTYNATQLPPKNSFALDYWGYYNGQISNAAAVPNGSRFVNSALGINDAAYGNNGDNHSANLTYAEACTLTQIQYPTGGTVNFNYELNQFNNYWVPDFSTNTNTISHGDGLRIKSITFKDSAGNQLKSTLYSYSGGQGIIPMYFFRTYENTFMPPNNPNELGGVVITKFYSINESNMSGYFSSDPFASINGVGYSQVTKNDVDINNNTDGSVVSNFYNTPDQVYFSGTTANQISPVLPAYKNHNLPDNGILQSELYYDKNSLLLKKITNSYINVNSPVFYGARLYGYGSLVRYKDPGAGNGTIFTQDPLPQNMVAYYPIFDIETQLDSSTVTDYYGADSLTTTTTYNYDTNGQVTSTTKTNSTYNETTSLSYPYDYPNNPVLAAMTAAHRLSDIVSVSNSTLHSSSWLNRSYRQIGNLFVANRDTTTTALSNSPEITSYDQYDSSNGNLLQYTKNSVPNSFLWDYNKEYVIAEAKNALYSDIAYTSFEADGTGRWKFSGTPTPDPAAPTGQKVYNLANGNIYRDSLNAAKTYIVSYWSNNGAKTVSGSSSSKQGYTINGYTYFEHTIPNPASGTITISGTGNIDELRLYPNNAQMTTYTYAPLVGITSESNAGGRISYYEYDNAMRLLDIRDQNKHIVKAFCYNYAGQPTNCGVNISYSSQALSQSFTRNNCPSGDVGSSVTYSVPLGKYTSTMSLADANNQAQEDVAANGQTNANTNGSCIVPPVITSVGYGGHGTGYTEIVFTTIPNCNTAVITYKDLTTNQTYSSAGACSSPQFVTVPVVGDTYQFTVTCYSSDAPSGLSSAPFNYTAYQ